MRLKTWHTHENRTYLIGHFYPELGEVGKEEGGEYGRCRGVPGEHTTPPGEA